MLTNTFPHLGRSAQRVAKVATRTAVDTWNGIDHARINLEPGDQVDKPSHTCLRESFITLSCTVSVVVYVEQIIQRSL